MTQWGLDTLFNPAKRHMDEEKRRLQSTREEVGDASGGRRIDLESGKVTIQRDDEAADGTEEIDPSATDESAAGAKASKASKPAKAPKTPKDEKDLTPAQLRALKRRGRA
ncbi:DUF6191 domain-containing protein [Jatrophihabitans fulvus]